jgi:threonine/homoserine/homoserine lactone efflux protein
MSVIEFVSGVSLLLIAPGPTNTLLALGAAKGGLKRSLLLVAACVGAYLLVITPLATVAGAWLEQYPSIVRALKACAILWILYLALKLWRPEAAGERVVSAQQVFLTTLLNPKGIVIGLVLMPQGALSEVGGYLGILALLIIAASSAWLLLGQVALGQFADGNRFELRKIASLALVIFSLVLTSSLFA